MTKTYNIGKKIGAKFRMTYRRWALRRKKSTTFKARTAQENSLISIFRKTVCSPETDLHMTFSSRIAHNEQTNVTILLEYERLTVQDDQHTVVFNINRDLEEDFRTLFDRISNIRGSKIERAVKESVLHTMKSIEMGIETRRQSKNPSPIMQEFSKTTVIDGSLIEA